MKMFSVQGIKFNGTGSNCTISGTVGETVIKNQMTLRIRFKIISDIYPYDILIKDGEYKLGIDSNGNIVFSVWDGVDWEPSVIGSLVQINNWYDVICLINIGTNVINKIMYVNSITEEYSEITQSGGISQTTNSLIIGDSEVIVDNFMCWNRILSSDEINVIFNGGIIFNRLDFWLAFEDIDNNSLETIEVLYKRYKGILSNFEVVDGKDLEEIKKSENKVIIVKKY